MISKRRVAERPEKGKRVLVFFRKRRAKTKPKRIPENRPISPQRIGPQVRIKPKMAPKIVPTVPNTVAQSNKFFKVISLEILQKV